MNNENVYQNVKYTRTDDVTCNVSVTNLLSIYDSDSNHD